MNKLCIKAIETIIKPMNAEDSIKLSLYSAEQALLLFEGKVKNEKRPRKALTLIRGMIQNKASYDKKTISALLDSMCPLKNYWDETYSAIMAIVQIAMLVKPGNIEGINNIRDKAASVTEYAVKAAITGNKLDMAKNIIKYGMSLLKESNIGDK